MGVSLSFPIPIYLFLISLKIYVTFAFFFIFEDGQKRGCPSSTSKMLVLVSTLRFISGYMRDGTCRTIPEDGGTHVVCAVMTQEFLEYTKSKGNDLSTPDARYDFPGLNPGDRWCLCAFRWREA